MLSYVNIRNLSRSIKFYTVFEELTPTAFGLSLS